MSSHGFVAADAAVRASVLDASRSFMLQAPAGSGKTELLMQRYLACLATVDEPEAVLAITFTRKAAAEMRNRILRTLEEARAFGEGSLDGLPGHRRSALELARRALTVSELRGWQILDHPERLQVRTLDSFSESIAQRAPFKGQLGGTAQIAEDASPLYAGAATRVLETLAHEGPRGDAVALLLEHLDNDVRKARELVASMLAQREQWLRFLGRSDVYDAAQQDALRARLERALQEAVEEDLAAVDERLRALLTPMQRAETLRLLAYVSSLSEEPLAIAASAAETRHEDGWPAPLAAELPAWRAICNLFLKADGDLRTTVDKRSGFPSDTAEQKEWKRRCVALLKDVASAPDAAAATVVLSRVRQLPEPRYSDSQWEFIGAMLQLLPLAAAHLKLVFAEQGTVDFAEYSQRAIEAIGEDGDPTELGLQLGYRIRHVLVDEFQDTNRTQVELLSRLLRTWEEDEDCSTFYVGDPMQSIYAFRQADVAIYQRARRNGIGGRLHNFERLTQNFRSQEKLVAWFNEIFPQVLDEENEATNAVRYDLDAVPSRAALEDDAVFLRGFLKGDKQGEARHLAECVQQELARPVEDEKPVSIAILVRSRSHLPELVEALRAAGIRYRAVKTDRLAERPLVRDLETLRAALNDPADRTAWLSVLRAPWCGLELRDLLALCLGDAKSPRTLRELLAERAGQLSARAQEVLRRVLPVLDAALGARGRRPLRELVESTWLRLGGAACMAESAGAVQTEEARAQSVRDADAYFALLDAESSAGAVRDPELFAKKLGDLFSPPDTAPGIQVEIMPIHQAKGLEWDVVFLPALDRRPRNQDKSLLYWRLRRNGEEESLLLGPMEAAGNRSKGKEATIERYMRRIANGCAGEELKRLFYVAATRARKRLYLSAGVRAEKAPNSDSMLRLLWGLPGMAANFAPPEEPESGASAALPQLSSLLRRLPREYELPAVVDALDWEHPAAAEGTARHKFEWVGDLLPRVGQVAHSYLQRIAAEGVEHWDDARIDSSRAAIGRALLAAGAAPGDVDQGVGRVVEALRRTLQDERGRWLLAEHDEAQSEFALSAVLDGRVLHIRVDRTFVENGVRWLVDYKIAERQGGDRERFLAIQADKYRADLERYARVLALYDPRPVRCALYLPLLGEFVSVELP